MVGTIKEISVNGSDDESDEVIPFRYAISSYGADYPVDSLVKRIKNEDIFVPPFQRRYVWDVKKASRFIESLLLGLPVPGIFLSREPKTQQLLVIDGQQRLLTLYYFNDGIFADSRKEFALTGVQQQFEGLTYKTLSDADRRRLADSILHATIVKQDQPSNDESSIYQIFERLNTGGVHLRPQEIRTAIYHGAFSNLIKHLNKNEAWRLVYGPVNKNMRDQELILRFLALYFRSDSYSKAMKEFLNEYMGSNRELQINSEDEIRKVFSNTIEAVRRCLGEKVFKPKRQINAAVFDAVMVGVARRLVQGSISDCKALQESYRNLLDDRQFTNATQTATTDEENVK